MKVSTIAIAVTLSLTLSACVPLLVAGAANNNRSREQSLRDRQRATALAEEDGRKILAKIDDELDRQRQYATVLGQTSPRAGCVHNAQANHKACIDRNALFMKSSLSVFRSRADPERCETDLASTMGLCAKLPEAN